MTTRFRSGAFLAMQPKADLSDSATLVPNSGKPEFGGHSAADESVRLTRVTLHFGNSERHCRRCNRLSIDKLRGASIFQQTIRVASLT